MIKILIYNFPLLILLFFCISCNHNQVINMNKNEYNCKKLNFNNKKELSTPILHNENLIQTRNKELSTPIIHNKNLIQTRNFVSVLPTEFETYIPLQYKDTVEKIENKIDTIREKCIIKNKSIFQTCSIKIPKIEVKNVPFKKLVNLKWVYASNAIIASNIHLKFKSIALLSFLENNTSKFYFNPYMTSKLQVNQNFSKNISKQNTHIELIKVYIFKENKETLEIIKGNNLIKQDISELMGMEPTGDLGFYKSVAKYQWIGPLSDIWYQNYNNNCTRPDTKKFKNKITNDIKDYMVFGSTNNHDFNYKPKNGLIYSEYDNKFPIGEYFYYYKLYLDNTYWGIVDIQPTAKEVLKQFIGLH